MRGRVTLDSVGVVRVGDLAGVRLPSTHGDNSMALLDSLKMGRLGESPVNLSMIPGCAVVREIVLQALGALGI